ncbi:hypothetical protein GCM10011369_27970 [Neiella marina]|uniref:Agl cluster protein AglQ n=1 Tax=Neiella marina TaxID=508461 RepID=A0A8J2XNM3_9GAMM|nr:hypothetical protein [Neiella marina]GGA84342.1 hypothetical protein GCM10011369_27970 [Neiella marina]
MLDSIVISLADKALQQLEHQGFIKGGHNGPYFDPETPVRNTAHWATTFAILLKRTGDEKYRQAVAACINYLKSQAARPMNSAFHCRTSVRKDFSNGTIGQAWAIEGLVSGYQVLGDESCLQLAEETFLLHVFDERMKIWKIRNVDGSLRDFDMTFNHQLWLAAAGYVLLSVRENETIRRQCDAFMGDLPLRLRVYRNGLIKHDLINTPTAVKKLKSKVDAVMQAYRLKKAGKTKQYKENGYHLFNVYAFALIKEYGGNDDFLGLPAFEQALAYCVTDELLGWQEEANRAMDYNNMKGVTHDEINIYGYGYNAPGFELPYIAKVFGNLLPSLEATAATAINKQLEYTYNQKIDSFANNTEDANTLNARIYEYVRSWRS